MKVAAAAALALLATAAASAAPPVAARLNGRDVRDAASVTLRANDRLETGDAPLTVRTAGGTVTVAPGSTVTHQGVERGVEYLFVAAGSVEGDVGPAAAIGAAASWAAAPDGRSARVRVTAGPADRSTFRTLSGGAWLRFHAVSTWLPEGCEVGLVPSVDGPGSLSFTAAGANAQPVEVLRTSGGRSHAAIAAAGVSGTLADRGGATRFACRSAAPGSLLRVEVRRDGRAISRASVGPGAEAWAEGERVRVEIPAAPRGLLRDLLSQEVEFVPRGGR